MKNNYVFMIDENGHRITTIVDNMLEPVGKKELLKKAKTDFPDAKEYIYMEDGDSMMDDFLAGKIYKDEKMIDAPIIEPTTAEIKKQKITEIKQSYESKFKSYEDSLIRARLAGNEIQATKIQEQYKADIKAMALEIKGA